LTAEAPAPRLSEPVEQGPPRLTIRFLIANCFSVGGTIKATFDLAGELAKRHDVEIVSVYRTRTTPAFPIPEGVEVRALHDRSTKALDPKRARTFLGRLRRHGKKLMVERRSRLIPKKDYRYPSFNLLTDVRLLQFLRSTDDGIVIGTRIGLNLALARFGRRSAIRVGQEHLNLTKYGSELRKLIRRHYPKLDAYSTLTEGDAAAYRELVGPGLRIGTIPNGIEPREWPRSDTRSKVVVSAGRFRYQKGFDRLIQAWALVAQTHPDWKLRIYGEGSVEEELRGLIAELGLEESAELMAFTPELPDRLAASGFYVMSSRFEGFPVVLLEAMACGLPVVSFDCPTGPAELISHGEDGFLVPDGDVEGLAAAINEMIELGEGRKALGEAALAKAARYTLPSTARRWESLLLELAAERARSGPSRAGSPA
jgi:glycosyltransferase involved in cell wall biosynthesis